MTYPAPGYTHSLSQTTHPEDVALPLPGEIVLTKLRWYDPNGDWFPAVVVRQTPDGESGMLDLSVFVPAASTPVVYLSGVKRGEWEWMTIP